MEIFSPFGIAWFTWIIGGFVIVHQAAFRSRGALFGLLGLWIVFGAVVVGIIGANYG